MVNFASSTVKPEAEPVIDNTSVSAATLSVLVVKVNVPDPEEEPAAIVTSNDSSPEGIE